MTWDRWLRGVTIGAIMAGYLYFFPFFQHLGNPNENVRVYMVMAIVDHGTFALNRVIAQRGFVDDRATNIGQRCVGRVAAEPCTYSSKAPGTSYLGVPVYAALRTAYALAGTEPDLPTTIYVLRLVCLVLPSLVFIAAFDRFLRRYLQDTFLRLLVVATVALGTMDFTFAHQFASHQLVAILVFGSFMLIEEAHLTGRTRLAFAAGFAAWYAAISEYPALLAAVALTAYVVARHGRGWRSATGLFMAGGLVPAILVAIYHTICFGRPWRTGYSMLANPAYAQFHRVGVDGIGWPSFAAAYYSLLSPARGLFFFAPFLILGLPGLFMLWRRHRAEGLLACVMVSGYFVFQSAVNPDIGGWSIGPRYIVLVTPFLAFAAAGLLEQMQAHSDIYIHAVVVPLALLSIVFTFLSTIVFHTFPPAFSNPFYEWVMPLVRMDYFNYSFGTWLGLRGFASALPGLVPVGVLIVSLAIGASIRSVPGVLVRAATTALVASILFTALGHAQRFEAADKTREFERLIARWEPGQVRDDELEAARLAAGNRPRDPEAQARFARLLARLGQWQPALEAYSGAADDLAGVQRGRSADRSLGTAVDERAEPELEADLGEQRSVEFASIDPRTNLNAPTRERRRQIVRPGLQLSGQPPPDGHRQAFLVAPVDDTRRD